MPRHQPDYSKGQIYFLSSDLDPRIYVGSTTHPLNVRLAEHRSTARQMKKKSLLYRTMREVGIESYRIDCMIECPCGSKEELEIEEFAIIAEFEPEDLLNANIVFGKQVSITGASHGRWRGGCLYHDEKNKRFVVQWSINGGSHRKYFPYNKKHNRTEEEALKAAEQFKAALFQSEDSEDSTSDSD